MTIGDLIDMIRAVEAAEKAVTDAERAIDGGGGTFTMTRKQEALDWAIAELSNLREEEIKF